MRVSLTGQLCIAILLLSACNSEAQDAVSADASSSVLAELNGVWTLKNDSGQASYVAFAHSPHAIYRGRLAEVEITAVKRYADAEAEAAGLREALDDGADLSEISERLGDVLIDRIDNPRADESMREQGKAEASSAINARLRERMGRRLGIMEDAVEHGDGTLTTVNIAFARAPDLVGDLDQQSTSLAYSGDRLYFVIRERTWIYDRVSTLSGQSAGDWPNGGRSAWERRLENEYTRLFDRCVVYQRSDLPLDECREHRDAMAGFGVKLQPEIVLERFRDFDKPSAAEMSFWRNRMPSRDTWSDTFPALDYCYSGVSSSGSVAEFVASLAGKGFANTLWRLTMPSSAPVEKPRNWSDQEFRDWAPGGDQLLSSLQGAIFLRADGVLGFGPNFDGLGFDPRNRWTYADGLIRLTWNDESIDVRIPIADFVYAEGTTNLALADQAFIELVLGNYDLLTKMPYPERHPDYERLKPYTESQRCDIAEPTITVAKSTPAPAPAPAPAPEIENQPADIPGPRTKVEKAPVPPALIGCWRWSNGAQVALKSDGVALNGSIRGHWRVSGAPNQFEIEWPPIEDSITLASNGHSLDGVGAFGIRYSATRIGQGTGLAGQWRRQDGVLLEFSTDGVATGGPLRGHWMSGSEGKYRIEWPLVDDVTVSESGENLNAVNQFGRVTAKRRAGC